MCELALALEVLFSQLNNIVLTRFVRIGNNLALEYQYNLAFYVCSSIFYSTLYYFYGSSPSTKMEHKNKKNYPPPPKKPNKIINYGV